MSGDPSFWSELKDRRVVRVALVYLAVGWFVFEASDTLTEVLELPDVTPRLVLALVVLGFPIALTLAWIYQRTPTGVERAEPYAGSRRFSIPILGVVAVAILAVALTGWQLFGVRSADPTPDPKRLAVFPFAVRSPDADHAYLGDGLAELLSTALHGSDIQVVDPGVTISRQPLQDQQESTARELGAGHYVSGSVSSVGGGRVQVRASLFTLGQSSPVTAQTTGDPDRLLTMVGALTRQLLVGHAVLSLGQVDSLALTMTDSVDALKAYLRGLTHYRAQRWDAAIEDLSRAVEIDSAFAIAYLPLALAAGWDGRQPLDRLAAEAGVRAASAPRVSARHRRLLEMLNAYEHGNGPEVERLGRAILQRYPGDLDALYMLGETRVHLGPYYGQPTSAAREPLLRVFRQDPDRGDVWFHLGHLLMGDDAPELLDSVYRARGFDPDSAFGPRAWRAFREGDTTAQEALVREGAGSFWRGVDVALAGGVEAARGMFHAVAAADTDPDTRAGRTLWATGYDIGTGRWQAHREAWDGLRSAAPVHAAEAEALRAALPYLSLGREELEAVRGRLLATEPERAVGCVTASSIFACWVDQLHPHLRYYLLGMLSARLGDWPAAEAWVDSVEALPHVAYGSELRPGLPTGTTLREDYALGIRAAVAAGRGRPEEALRLLEQISTATYAGDAHLSPYLSLRAERYLQADLAAQLGQSEDALRRLASLESYPEYRAASALRRAEIFDATGAVDSALVQYGVFLEWWENADRAFQPLVDDVRRRVAKLVEREQ